MKRMVIFLIAAALALWALPAFADGDGIAFDAKAVTVREGETLQTELSRNGAAADGELTWTSSDPKTVSVDENGLVSGLKKGRAVITATVRGEKKSWKAQLGVTVVRPVKGISVRTDKLEVFDAGDAKVAPYLSARENPEENELPVLMLPVKKTQQLTVDVDPKDATDRKVVLTSSDPAVFTANAERISGAAPGDAILTIASESDPDVLVRYRVLVVQPAKKLAVSAEQNSVAVGGQIRLTAEISPEDATVRDVIWSSGDERIATVDENGVVTGVRRGNGRIVVSAADGSNIRANYSVKVVQNPETLTLSADEVTVDVGRNTAVKATVGPKDADNKKVVWSSSDESIATVSKDGRITGKALGDCTVTCTSDALPEVSASLTVHVQQPVKTLVFNDKNTFGYVGDRTQLTWTVTPENATNPKIAFSSANERIATVDENGVVTGVGSGTTTINAVTTDGSNRRAKITVKVGSHVTGINMVREHAYIGVKETATFGADLEPKDATDNRVVWVSSDESVVTVSGNTNHKAKMTGVGYGEATITGTTVDGGYTDSIQVTVDNFDQALKLQDFGWDSKGNFWLKVKNVSNLEITRITASVQMFDATQDDNPEVPINTKNGSNEVDIVWTGRLYPGEVTGSSHWKMVNYRMPSGMNVDKTRGSVTVYSFQIDGDWIKTIRKSYRKYLDY